MGELGVERIPGRGTPFAPDSWCVSWLHSVTLSLAVIFFHKLSELPGGRYGRGGYTPCLCVAANTAMTFSGFTLGW